IALLLGTMYQDDAANRGARTAAGTPQTTASIRKQTDPAEAYALYNRGVWHRQRNEYAQGIPELDQAIRLKPDFAEAYEERGYAYLRLNRYERAIHDFDAALRLKPNDAQTYGLRGVAYADSGDYQTARQNFNAATR